MSKNNKLNSARHVDVAEEFYTFNLEDKDDWTHLIFESTSQSQNLSDSISNSDTSKPLKISLKSLSDIN